MEDPKPINVATDDEFRAQGWPAVARDADGHAVSVCARREHEDAFREWLAECFDSGYTVTNLNKDERSTDG